MSHCPNLLACPAVWFLAIVPAAAESAPEPPPSTKDVFSQPYTFLSREARRAFFSGNALFNENWVAAPSSTSGRDGLGPLFQARSCSACHRFDGRGLPPSGLAAAENFVGLVVKMGAEPQGHLHYGTQVSPQAVPGAKPEASLSLQWEEQPAEKFADGSTYRLRKPKITYQNWSGPAPPVETAISLRLAPAVFGGGLLEGIPAETLRQWADPQDANADGISGRVAEFPSRSGAPGSGLVIGRFGWKANEVDLADQTAAAFLLDMGLRTSRRPYGDLTPEQERHPAFQNLPHGGSPEVSDLIFSRVVHYLQALAPPPVRNANHPAKAAGSKLFQTLLCAECHRPAAQTGPTISAALPELANRSFAPYTDLLLHDMGPALADGRPDQAATAQEWRTPPLWGLGWHEAVTGNVAYLHDGRARSLSEAILWHGGEAQASSDGFKKLSAAEQKILIDFLNECL